MLRNRIRSNSGATILLALLFFLLCALAGSIILSAGSAAAGRISGLKETEQSFLFRNFGCPDYEGRN